jgi:hypothetical protein
MRPLAETGAKVPASLPRARSPWTHFKLNFKFNLTVTPLVALRLGEVLCHGDRGWVAGIRWLLSGSFASGFP